MEHQVILEKAMQLIQERKPEASAQKKAAFAGSVAYLVTGWSGGYGGPSVREHAVSRVFIGLSGQYNFESAVEMMILEDGPIFGPIRDIHRDCWATEHCFDDDPQDVAELNS